MHHGADGGNPRRDHAVIGGRDTGLGKPDLIGCESRLERGKPRTRRGFRSGRLAELLRTDEAAFLQLARAFGVGHRFREGSLGFGDGGPRLHDFGVDGIALQPRQQLPVAHAIPDVDRNFDGAQSGRFRPDYGFLPCRNTAAGFNSLRPAGLLCGGGCYGQCRFGSGGNGCGRYAVAGWRVHQHPQNTGRYHYQKYQDYPAIFHDIHSVHLSSCPLQTDSGCIPVRESGCPASRWLQRTRQSMRSPVAQQPPLVRPQPATTL